MAGSEAVTAAPQDGVLNFCVLLEALNTLTGVFSQNSIQSIARLKHFLGVDLDIRGLDTRR
jgi:hypothetical protein